MCESTPQRQGKKMPDADENSPSTDSTDVDVDQAEMVVNVDSLMAYVNEMLDGGRELFIAGEYKASENVYNQGLDAISQCEGLPIAVDDVPRVVMAKSLLSSFKAEIYIKQELYRRALPFCDTAAVADPNNGAAFLYRIAANHKLKEYTKALDDLQWLLRNEMIHRNRDAVLEFFASAFCPRVELSERLSEDDACSSKDSVVTPGGEGSTADAVDSALTEAERTAVAAHLQRKEARQVKKGQEALDQSDAEKQEIDAENRALLRAWGAALLRKKRDWDNSFEERVEEAQFAGLKELKEQFDEIVERTGLKRNEKLAEELADFIQQEGNVSAEKLASVYGIDVDDAHTMLKWIQTQTKIHTVLNTPA
eukprot:g3607.t1